MGENPLVSDNTSSKERTTRAPILVRANASWVVTGALMLACAALAILFHIQGYLAQRHDRQLQEKRRLVAGLQKDRQASALRGAENGEATTQPPAETPATAAKDARAEICDFALRELLRDPEPFSGDALEMALPDGTWNVRRRVKSADTQRPGAVREVDCRIDAAGDVYSVARVP